MQLKYIFLTLALSIATGSFAQNIPVLTETAPTGTVNTITPFPEVNSGTGDINVIKTFVPLLPVTNAASISESSAANAVRQQMVYLDGTGTAYQSITKNVATVGGQPKHLIQLNYIGTEKDQFSFLPYGTSDSSYQTQAISKQAAYYSSLYPDEGYSSFSKSVNASSTTVRASITYAQGKSQVGQSRGTKTSSVTNTTNEVRMWDIDASGVPTSSGYYSAGELFGQDINYPLSQVPAIIGAAAGPITRAFTDKSGRLVAKMVADNSYISIGVGSKLSVKISWQYTYYVYDVKGNLRTTITPKAFDYFVANGSLNAAVVNDLCFSNVYDAKGRVAGTHKPGERGFTWAVYDRKNRLIMRQSPNEAINSEWEITFYDVAGKVKATSVFTDAKNLDHNEWQTLIDNGTATVNPSNLLYYLATDAGEKAYPYNGDPRTLTSIIPNNVMMSYSWYDNYYALSFAPTYNDCVSQLNFTETFTTAGAEAMTLSKRTQGMLTASMVRVLRSPNASSDNLGDWRVAVNYYDDKGRVINAVSFTDNQTNGAGQFNYDYAGTQYDFANRVLITKHVTIKHNAAPGQQGVSHTELNKTVYDANSGSPTQIWHKIDNTAWSMLSSFVYDDMGRVKQKNIGNGGEIQDYTYNIRGQLTGINAFYAETGNKQNVSRTFGESIKYDYGFTLPRYDGKIAGIIWRGASGLDMFAYGYAYTQNLALKSADFRIYQGGVWTNQDIDFSVSNLQYDRNGNITSMKQRGEKPGVGPVDMDNLVYAYNTNSNQLSAVVDNGVTYYGAGDFKNGTNSGADYEYDPNGNVSKDLNRDVKSISFTRFNKPVAVEQNNGSTVEYSYDASGAKLEEIVKNKDAGTLKRTDYIGNCIYQNSSNTNASGDNLQYILTAEGRTVYTALPAPKTTEEYFVKDHLGNIRSVISVSSPILIPLPAPVYQASYELANSNVENLVFDKINEVRDVRPGATPSNTMAARLNGNDADTKVGTSLMVHVMAGDKMSMNVNSYYPTYNAKEDIPVKGDEMLNAVVSTLTGGAGAFAGAELHDVKLVKNAFNVNNFKALEDIVKSETDPAKPRAYLNYALFDEKMHLVKEMSGAFQANGENGWSEIGTTNAMEVPTNGYLAVYLSNSSKSSSSPTAETVYFDQFVLQVRKGVLLEETHYYPFGLPIQGLSSQTVSNFKDNRYKYQGNELIKDLDLNWMDFQARTYDQQLGRFMNIDPLAALGGQDMFSPYAAMGNTPESNIDPNGLTPRLPYFDVHPQLAQTDGGGGSGASSASGGLNNLGSIFGDAGVEGYVHGGGYDPGFSSLGLSSLVLNTFHDFLPNSMRQQVNADYGSYISQKQNNPRKLSINDMANLAEGNDGEIVYFSNGRVAGYSFSTYTSNTLMFSGSIAEGFIIEGFSITSVGAAALGEIGIAVSGIYLSAYMFALIYDGAITEPSYGAPCSTLVNGVPVVFMAQQAEMIQNAMRQSKGGKQNLRDDQLSPLGDDELAALKTGAAAAGNTVLLEKIKTEEKWRGIRNKQKRKKK